VVIQLLYYVYYILFKVEEEICMKKNSKRFLTALLAVLLVLLTMPAALAQNAREGDNPEIEIYCVGDDRAVAPGNTLELYSLAQSGDKIQSTWKVDNEEIATINEETGVLEGKKTGTVVVTATAKNDPDLTSSRSFLVDAGVCRILGKDSYPTFQDAINAAETGAVIEVFKNLDFKDEITIDKDLTLKTVEVSPNDKFYDRPLVMKRQSQSACLKVTDGTLTMGNLMWDGNRDNYSGSVAMLTIEKGASVNTSLNGNIYSASSSENGGGVLNRGTLTMTRSYVANCVSRQNGGAIYNEGTLNVVWSGFEKNAAQNGGAVYNTETGSVNILTKDYEDAWNTFRENIAANLGGGIYNAGSVQMDSGVFANNSGAKGSSIYQNGTLIMDNNPKKKIDLKNDEPDNLYLATGKVITLSGTEINNQSNIYITSEEMGPGKNVDVIKQQDGKEITSSYPFLSQDDNYSILFDSKNRSVLQLTGNSKIYVGPDGNDQADGYSVENAVKSLERAVAIGKEQRKFILCVLPENAKGETAVLGGTADVSRVLTEFISCDAQGNEIEDPQKANTVTRNNPTATVQIGDQGIVGISNIIFEGGSAEAQVPLFTVNGGNGSSLLLQKGTVIKNAKSTGDCGGMLIGVKGNVTMDSASILNCSATGENSVGGIKNSGDSQALSIESGTISGCSGTLAGGVYQGGFNEGTPSMRVTAGGVIDISKNYTAKGVINNIYLPKGSTLLYAAEELSDGSNIGITAEAVPTEKEPVLVVIGPENLEGPLPITMKGLTSDSDNYKFAYLDGDTKNKIGLELKQNFTIVAEVGDGGTINPAGSVAVKEGQNQSFAITPENGYEIADVMVDGKSIGAQAGYTFENITENHRISATFKVKTTEQYKIEVSSEGNGAAKASTDKAKKGTVVTLTATPDKGYQFKEWRVDAGGVKVENNQFTMADSDVKITAVFEKTPAPVPGEYTITINSDGNGTASADTAKAKAGTVVKLSQKTNKGYQFKEWKVEAGTVTIKDNQFTMPEGNVVIKAVFEKTVTPTPTPSPSPSPVNNVSTGITSNETSVYSAVVLLSVAGLMALVIKRKMKG
jgi:hypothetical protein